MIRQAFIRCNECRYFLASALRGNEDATPRWKFKGRRPVAQAQGYHHQPPSPYSAPWNPLWSIPVCLVPIISPIKLYAPEWVARIEVEVQKCVYREL